MPSQNQTETSQSQSFIENDPQKPRKEDDRINSIDFLGFEILVGRNALSNEKLVKEHKEEHKHCIWMHVFNARGSHVIICRKEKKGEIPEIVFRRAMDIAIWFSAEREKNNRIIWSELQDVYKPDEGRCGTWRTYKYNNVTKR